MEEGATGTLVSVLVNFSKVQKIINKQNLSVNMKRG